MKLSPEIEAKGMTAYEQARAFERLRSWRLPLSFAVLTLVPLLGGGWLWHFGHMLMAESSVPVTVLVAAMGWFQWRHLHARYAENLRLLAQLKSEHGNQLPWIQVENHLAALQELKRELATPAEDDF